MHYAEALGHYLTPIMKNVFRLPGSAATALILGSVGGYPIGARTAAQLYENGSLNREQTHHILGFCNNAGPAFVIGVVGTGVFGSTLIGLILYAIHLLSAMLLGVLLRPQALSHQISFKNFEKATIPQVWTSAIAQGAETALRVCGFVLFFSVMSGHLKQVLPNSTWSGLLLGCMELTAGTAELKQAACSPAFRFIAAAFLIGIGGLCVMMQSFSVIQAAGLSGKPLIKGKILHGVLSALLAAAASPLLPLSVPCILTDTALYATAPQQCAVFFVIITAMGVFLKNTSGKLSDHPL